MNNQLSKVKRVVIAGGGTAGWMTAAAMGKLIGKTIDITLIESDEIGTVGVGEATIPTLHIFHRLLGIKPAELMAATNATFKLGISFENWRQVDHKYMHSFGYLGKDCWAGGFQHFWLKGLQNGISSEEIGDYCAEHLAARENKFAILANQEFNHAYHLDAGLYAKFLRKIAEQHGVTRKEGKIEKVNVDPDSGFITSLNMADKTVVEGDLFIDCSGFKGLLIEEALHTGFEDWSHWLPCDRAVAVQTENVQPAIPYTRSIARSAGWQWRIPLQSRTGNGHVFCSRYMSDEEGKQLLLDNVEGKVLTDPRVIKFRTGTRRKHWNKNCVAIGLSSGFIEPLESTSIHLIQRGIIRLLQNFPKEGIRQPDIDHFNKLTEFETAGIRDFIILHYHVTERRDSDFWNYCRTMPIPESLQHRIDLFKQTGKVFKELDELFGESSWLQVMLGQGLQAEQYHSIVDMMDDRELENFLEGIRKSVRARVSALPMHNDFINHHCKSNVV
ncbi:tryptophan halogenase family protein [Paraglaciecola sp. 2405UD69-4]|uniref:tryptophan halogenase family protein n=1 Tax=Paraglaciecola sp. 2405UD69-4 TaxID=3391836 RepID=UPI0039C9D868